MDLFKYYLILSVLLALVLSILIVLYSFLVYSVYLPYISLWITYSSICTRLVLSALRLSLVVIVLYRFYTSYSYYCPGAYYLILSVISVHYCFVISYLICDHLIIVLSCYCFIVYNSYSSFHFHSFVITSFHSNFILNIHIVLCLFLLLFL